MQERIDTLGPLFLFFMVVGSGVFGWGLWEHDYTLLAGSISGLVMGLLGFWTGTEM